MSNLSLFLEKKIICILLNEINKFNKTIPSYSEKEQVRIKKTQDIIDLLKSISLVNWFWFNTVSSLLNSIVNFHHSPTLSKIQGFKDIAASSTSNEATLRKFKLIENENIKYIRIDLVDIEIKNKSSEEKYQLLHLLNNNISSYGNLKKLSISNGSSSEEIYFINKINFNYINIAFLYLNYESEGVSGGDIYSEPLLSKNIKEIVDIEGSDLDVERVVSILKPLRKVESLILDRFTVSKYRQLYIQLYLDGDESKLDQDYNDNNYINNKECCLLYTRNFTIDDYQVQTYESLYYALKLVPRVESLSFQICFDNLVKQLDSSGQSKGCMCMKFDKCNEQFQYYWDGISKIIQNHQHLSYLSIGQHCFYPIAYSKPFELPDEFVRNFGTTIGMNQSITYLNTSKLPSNIINLIQFITKMNPRIVYHKHYFLNMSGPTPEEYLLEYTSFLKENNHIKMFLIDDALSSSEVLTYTNDSNFK